MLIMDVINGGILFVLDTAIALLVNYRQLNLQSSRLIALQNGEVDIISSPAATDKHYIEEESIDVEDLKNLEHLYNAYTAMGGNGTCKQLYERVCALKFKTDEGEIRK